MRTPANGHPVGGRPADGYNDAWGQYDDTRGQYDDTRGQYDDTRGQYDDTRGQYRAGGPHQDGTPSVGDPYTGHLPESPAADRYITGSYPADSYSTARYTGVGYEQVAPGVNRAPEREIAGQGYSPAGENVPTQLFRPTRDVIPDRDRGPANELDLDEPRRRAPAPPPLRNPTQVQPTVQQRAGWSALGVPASSQPPAPKGPRLRVDWPNCKAHGLCHELLPEAIRLDEWGFPIVGKQPLPEHVIDDARRAVIACPTLALRLVD